MNRSHFLILIFLITLSANAEDVIRYEVQKNDSLSKILYKLNIGPIYGPKGFQQLASEVNNLPVDGSLKVGTVLVFPTRLVNKKVRVPAFVKDSKSELKEEKKILGAEVFPEDATREEVEAHVKAETRIQEPTIAVPTLLQSKGALSSSSGSKKTDAKKLKEMEGYTPPSHHDFTLPVDPGGESSEVTEEPAVSEKTGIDPAAKDEPKQVEVREPVEIIAVPSAPASATGAPADGTPAAAIGVPAAAPVGFVTAPPIPADLLKGPTAPGEKKTLSKKVTKPVEPLPPAPAEVIGPLPAVDVALAPRIMIEEASDEDQFHSLIASPQVSWANFISESSDQYQKNKLKVFTRTIPTLNLQYQANWDRNWNSLVFASISQVSFYPDDQVRYKEASVSRNSFGLGLGYRSGGQEWGARFGFFDKLFYTLPSTTVVEPDVVAMPEVVLTSMTDLKQYKKMVMKLGLSALVIIPHDSPRIKGELGYGGEAALYVGSRLKNLKLFYGYEQVNAKNNKTSASEFGLAFVIEGRFYE